MTKKEPVRSCLGCRVRAGKKDLIRIVRSGESVEIDKSGKKPGRGAYVCLKDNCIEKGIRKKILEKALNTKISDTSLNELKKRLYNIAEGK